MAIVFYDLFTLGAYSDFFHLASGCNMQVINVHECTNVNSSMFENSSWKMLLYISGYITSHTAEPRSPFIRNWR